MRLLLRKGLRMRVPYVQLHLRAMHLMSCTEHGGPRLVLPALPLPHVPLLPGGDEEPSGAEVRNQRVHVHELPVHALLPGLQLLTG